MHEIFWACIRKATEFEFENLERGTPAARCRRADKSAVTWVLPIVLSALYFADKPNGVQTNFCFFFLLLSAVTSLTFCEYDVLKGSTP